MCPKCQMKQRMKGRNWLCKRCGFVVHRNLLRAMNM
ncbi:MAG: transposase [Rickettsia sp.]|nr:transposase [Rickettsia sp.]